MADAAGVSSLPFVQRISGDVFMDAGNAGFGPWRIDTLAVGAGLEVLVDLVLGYILLHRAHRVRGV
ncbi:MAG: hypothetical protein R3A52_21290 [Polyangiales bacterium]